MKTRTLLLEIPNDAFLAINEPENELLEWIKLVISIQFYKKGKLTIGKAAQLANLTRFEFENLLVKNGFPISNLLHFLKEILFILVIIERY
ncbi:MAG: UPF0175 family protein [Leptospiraceae bacterium]|nr:UPF0175 family protein [Leptospiraceae bacterium]